MTTEKRNRWVLVIIVATVSLVSLGLLAVWVTAPQPAWIQGQIEVTQVRAATKVTGRVESIDVVEGDRVTEGQQIAVVSSPEIVARAAQAEALVAAAQAQADMTQAGARDEEIRAAQAQWQAADAQAALAEMTLQRMERLFNDGVMPAQARDEAHALAASARAQANAAREVWQMSQQGARTEDQRAAEAMLAQAQGGRAEVQAFLDEEQVLAPAGGEVTRRVFQSGEIAPAGAPLVLIARTDDPWLTLNLREDMLANVRLGTELRARVPALGDLEVRFVVDYIAPMADFATWRSTRDLGGFDLRSFEVRARPKEAVEGLRPGMSVLIAESDLAPEQR